MTDIYMNNDSVLVLAGLKNEIPAATTGDTVLSVDGLNTFSRVSGDFIADGFAVGMEVQPSGFTNDINNEPYTVADVQPLVLTVNEDCLVQESGDGCERLDGHEFLNTSAVEVTVLDQTGTEVNGETWPIPLSYVAGSFGVYRATLPFTLELSNGRPYIAQIVSDGGLGLRNQWDFPMTARIRKS